MEADFRLRRAAAAERDARAAAEAELDAGFDAVARQLGPCCAVLESKGHGKFVGAAFVYGALAAGMVGAMVQELGWL